MFNSIQGRIHTSGGSLEGLKSTHSAVVQFNGTGYDNPHLRKMSRPMNIPSSGLTRMRAKGLPGNIITDLRHGKGMKAMAGCFPTLERMRHLL
jgi:hypothetical protein